MDEKPHYTPTQWAVRVVGVLLLPVALLFGRLFAGQVNETPVICVWRRFFGWHCPGCGMTRALCLFATGQWGESIHTNWLIVPVVAAALVVCLGSLLWLIRACTGKGQC